jgi:microcystin-dependent protein
MADANYTMSNFNGVVDEARNQVLVVAGTNTAVRNLIAPLVEKTYLVKNDTVGGYSIQIIGSSGLGVTIPNGIAAYVYCDGTNFYNGISGSVGNFAVNGNLSVTGNLTVTGITNIIPAGVIQMWPTASAPTGFLLCTGTAISRTTYATLFAVIGTTFGVGDGSTTFNLPNYTNRMPYGATVGSTGGSADAIVVSHNHGGSTGTQSANHSHSGTTAGMNQNNPHSHSGTLYREIGSNDVIANGDAGVPESNYTTGSTDIEHSHNFTTGGVSADHVHSIATQGASGTNANLPPYLGINFIIKS